MRRGTAIESYSRAAVKAQPSENSDREKPNETILCDLPVELINRTLGMELEAGPVVLTRARHVHAARRHQADFPRCLPHLAAVIADPLYIGDDLDNAGIELICRVPALGEFMLVAIHVQVDEYGRYQIAS